MLTAVQCLDVSALEDEALYLRAYNLCAAHRQEKADSLKQATDKRLCVGAWLLLRQMLNSIGYDANKEPLSYGKYGKPFFINHPEISFSLSHSGRIVLCVISVCPVGCDVEKLNRLNDRTAARCFHSAEIAALQSGGVEKPESIWTLKESFVKCIGQGLSCPFNSFSVCSEGKLADTIVFQDKTYQLYPLAIEPTYTAACCIEGEKRERIDLSCLSTDIDSVLQ